MGQPKCVEHSTFSLYNTVRLGTKMIGLPNVGSTLYTYFSTPVYTIAPFFIPGCAVVVPASTSPSSVEIMKTIQEERCHSISVLWLKDFHDLLYHPHLGDYDLSSILGVGTSGNVVPKSLLDRAADLLPKANVFVVYGMTELTSVASAPAAMIGEGKGTTVGKPAPHVEIQLVDKDGQVVPLGQVGEVWVRGEFLFKGYHGDKEKTSQAMTADGWYKTGDLGVLDENGVLKHFGRCSDMIIRNAYNVHPSVIEAPLSKHPKVQDVRVVSVPNPASVEEICACIILKEGRSADSREMKTACVEMGMVPIEVPGYFVFFNEFPMTASLAKVDRKKLRLIAMEKLDLTKKP
ncbi:putative acyl-CoA synthetase YngI isoform X2 [Branchiostoma lanceolatum]